jgi:predicted NBD/HSP70 family sugar kinase
MKHCAGLDVSVKETAICIVAETGKIVREAKVTTEPEAIGAVLTEAKVECASGCTSQCTLRHWQASTSGCC